MATIVSMPSLGDPPSAGMVTRWYKAVGDTLIADDPLVTVETAKVSVDLPAPVAGVLTRITVGEGQDAEIGATLGVIGDPHLRPVVAGLSPTSGPIAGISVQINGGNLTPAGDEPEVLFGELPAARIDVAGGTLSAVAPAVSEPRAVHVRVRTLDGMSVATPAAVFTYVPLPVLTILDPVSGPAVGGTVVRVVGSGLGGASGVRFGATTVTSGITVNPAGTELRVMSPAGVGTVKVRVASPAGESNERNFRYL